MSYNLRKRSEMKQKPQNTATKWQYFSEKMKFGDGEAYYDNIEVYLIECSQTEAFGWTFRKKERKNSKSQKSIYVILFNC